MAVFRLALLFLFPLFCSLFYAGAASSHQLDNFFDSNHQKRFSWDDPILVAALHGRNVTKLSSRKPVAKKTLDKRVMLPSGENLDALDLGDAYKTQTCVNCPQNKVPQNIDVSTFTTEYMQQNILTTALKDKCIFYGKRKAAGMTPAGFSGSATALACKLGKKSIWMLWPYNGGDCNTSYYCVNRPCCWLYPIAQKNQQTAYFTAMSQAMARECTGDILVMTDDIQTSGPQFGIWWDTERVALIDNSKNINSVTAVNIDGSSFNDVTDVIGIRRNKFKERTPVNATYMEEVLKIVREWNEERQGKRLAKRDSCIGPVYEEEPGADYFG